MKWSEIINEATNTSELLRTVKDIVIQLEAQGATNISIEQLMDLLRHNTALANITVDENSLIDILANESDFSLERDAETGKMSLHFNDDSSENPTNEQNRNAQERIRKAALRSIRRNRWA